jgi:sugar phosphate isomerase/epimerase
MMMTRDEGPAMNRREFVRTSAAASVVGLPALRQALGTAPVATPGVQLFSLPRVMEKDFGAGIAMLAGMGYREVEMFGPFSFSAPEAIARWNAITPQLGFSGSGFFGLTAAQVRAALDEHRMVAPSIHTDLATLQTRMGALGEAGRTVGWTYVGLPSIPDELRRTLDDYKRMADSFNAIGAAAQREGLKFAYHNHGYGLQAMDGQIPLQVLLERTDPALVMMEMDIYWTVAGGADPVQLLRAHPGRYHLMHVKDMKERKRFAGDGGDAGQWMQLFPYMTTAGDGVMDLRAIISQAQTSGVKHFFIEQDLVADPETALKRSIDYIRSL